MIKIKTIEHCQLIPKIVWDENYKYFEERTNDERMFHLGGLQLDKDYTEQPSYKILKYVWDNCLPPCKILNWGEFLDDRKSKKFSSFYGLKWNSNVYHSFLRHCYTSEEREEDVVIGHSGFGTKDVNDEHIDIRTIPPNMKEGFFLEPKMKNDLESSYYHSAKAHWIINSVTKEGLWAPIQGVVLKQGEGYQMMIHPGSIRSLVFEEMDDPSFELVVFDGYNIIDSDPVELDDLLSFWKNKLEQREYGLDLSFSWIGGVLEMHSDFANTNEFRPKIFKFNRKITQLSKKKPLNIYIGVDKTHNDIEKITKYSIEKAVEKSWSSGYGAEYSKFNPEIKYLDVDKISEYNRPYANQSTWFTYSRFLIPYLENYEGFSMFVDDDILFQQTPLTMFYFLDPDDAIACIQYPHYEHEETKFDGEVNIDYPCKLWSSLMFFNNGHEDCKKLTPEAVNAWTGKQLHQFEWTDKISKIPEKYVFTEGYDDPDVKWDFSGIHYTRGGPWIDNMDYTNIANLETYNRIKDRYQNDSST